MKTINKRAQRAFSLSLLFFTLISCSQNTDFEGVWLYQKDDSRPDRFTALTIESSDNGYDIEYNSKGYVPDEKFKGVLKGQELHFIISSNDSAILRITHAGKLVFVGEDDKRKFTKQKEGFKPYVHTFQSTSDITLSDFVGEWIQEKDDLDAWKDRLRISVLNGVIKIDPYQIASCPSVFEFTRTKYQKNIITAKRVQFSSGPRQISDTQFKLSKDGKLRVKNITDNLCGNREIVFIKDD